jgi:hypothetical protein
VLELKVVQNDKPVTLRLEHSLLSISRWEAKNKKAFLGTSQKTSVELVEYFEEMLVSPFDRKLIYFLEPKQLEEVTEYINTPQTASSVPEMAARSNPFDRETVTSELVYYWMSVLQIPFEAEKWHLSRLMMLIRIANFKQAPAEKQDRAKMMARWSELNAKRKAERGTTG